MAKTASLNATKRPVSRYTDGGSCPALPPGACAIASQRNVWVTERTTGPYSDPTQDPARLRAPGDLVRRARSRVVLLSEVGERVVERLECPVRRNVEADPFARRRPVDVDADAVVVRAPVERDLQSTVDAAGEFSASDLVGCGGIHIDRLWFAPVGRSVRGRELLPPEDDGEVVIPRRVVAG